MNKEEINEGNQLRLIEENQKKVKAQEIERKNLQKSIRIGSEDRLQQECYIWFHNKYPSLRGLLNYNLNNSANVIQGKKNKSMGLQKGRADMELNYRGETYFFELKTERGFQSNRQKEWQKLIINQGFQYFIIRKTEVFKTIINTIINK